MKSNHGGDSQIDEEYDNDEGGFEKADMSGVRHSMNLDEEPIERDEEEEEENIAEGDGQIMDEEEEYPQQIEENKRSSGVGKHSSSQIAVQQENSSSMKRRSEDRILKQESSDGRNSNLVVVAQSQEMHAGVMDEERKSRRSDSQGRDPNSFGGGGGPMRQRPLQQQIQQQQPVINDQRRPQQHKSNPIAQQPAKNIKGGSPTKIGSNQKKSEKASQLQQQAYLQQAIPPKPPGSGQRPQTQSKQHRNNMVPGNQGLNKNNSSAFPPMRHQIEGGGNQRTALSQNAANGRIMAAQMPLQIQQQNNNNNMIMAIGSLPPQAQTASHFYSSAPGQLNNYVIDPRQDQVQSQYPHRNSEKPGFIVQNNNLMMGGGSYNAVQNNASSSAASSQQQQIYQSNGSHRQYQLSADKADSNRARRQIMNQIIRAQQNQGASSLTDMGTAFPQQQYIIQPTSQIHGPGESPLQMKAPSFAVGGGNSVLQLKRKKIKELLMGNAAGHSNTRGSNPVNLNAVEKEELQQQKRTLKLQMNVMKDENTRMKTKMAFMQQEMDRKDRDIEQLSLKLQQLQVALNNNKDNSQSNIAGGTSAIIGLAGTQSTNSGSNSANAVFESYIVNTLKKQNRELRSELDEKTAAIEKLKRDIKLTNVNEVQMELAAYMEECQRMRGMLEQLMLQNQQLQQLAQGQHRQLLSLGAAANGNNVISEQAHIEEAFNEKETQLMRETEMRLQLQQELLDERQQREKFQKKLSLADLRLKKFNQVSAENERRRKIIIDKQVELNKLKEEVELLRDKARERDVVNNKNKELVTKYYGQTSAMSEKDKRIEELKKENQKLQDLLRQGSGSVANKSSFANNSSSPQRGDTQTRKQPAKAVDIPKAPLPSQGGSTTAFVSMYGQGAQQMAELIVRGLKKQAYSQGSDNVTLKSYFNQHQEEIKKEVEYISKKISDTVKQQATNRLGNKLEILTANQNQKFKGYADLEKFVEHSLNIPEKDFKKVVIFNFILLAPSIKALNDITLQPLFDHLKKSGKLPQSVAGEAHVEEDYQEHQRGQASPDTQSFQKKHNQQNQLQQKQNEEKESKSHAHNLKQNSKQDDHSSSQQLQQKMPMAKTDSYEDDEFEGGNTEREAVLKKENMSSKQQETAQNGANSQNIKPAVSQQKEANTEEDEYEDDRKQLVQNQIEAAQPAVVNPKDQDDQDYEREYLEEQEQVENGEDGKEEGAQQTIQITEDQMLDIAESVFQLIADRLKTMNISVRKAFAKRCQVVDEFEGETNVIVIQASDFLDALRNPPLNIAELSELEVACLMRVLSKPEIDHAILLNELNLVLENFGISQVEDEEESLKEEVEKKKQKQTKKKQIKMFVQSNGNPESDDMFEVLRAVLASFNFQIGQLMAVLEERKYEQLVKSKKKEAKVELIKRDDFLEIIRERTQIDIASVADGVIVEILSQILQLDSKYSDVFQLKSIQHLLEEIMIRHNKEEQERKVMEEFYKPQQPQAQKRPSRKELERVGEMDEEPSGDNNSAMQLESQADAQPAAANVEVLNFEELMSQEEEEGETQNYEGAGEINNDGEQENYDEEQRQMMQQHHQRRPQALNEIAEEDAANEDLNSPLHPSRMAAQRESSRDGGNTSEGVSQ